MPTEKLFYRNVYERTFSGRVLECLPSGAEYEAVLDRTLFYPQGGGQPADRGELGGISLLDVTERGGVVYHRLPAPLPVGCEVSGTVDWPFRFSLMQHHTAEHIVSGLIRSLWGFDNVGFHMGADYVTLDTSGELSSEQLERTELEANRAVWNNIELQTVRYAEKPPAGLFYRSKKEVAGDVRIVTVPGFDSCACCGLHCRFTGEVGMIAFIEARRYKGGNRILLRCGEKALLDFRRKNRELYLLAALLSVKPEEAAQAAQRLQEELGREKAAAGKLKKTLFRLRAQSAACHTGPAVFFEEDLNPEELRHFAMILAEKFPLAAVFSPAGVSGGSFHYALAGCRGDLRETAKEMNRLFEGRGGGKAGLVQGVLKGLREDIEKYLQELKPPL